MDLKDYSPKNRSILARNSLSILGYRRKNYKVEIQQHRLHIISVYLKAKTCYIGFCLP